MIMTPTFESVLLDKYNIREKFTAVGTFVAYPNYTRDVSSLVMLGLSTRCLLVAKVILSGEVVDYELVSVSPLHLLSLNIHNYSQKKIVVGSPYKHTSWVYQLCSGEDQDIIWVQFVDQIKKKLLCQTYCCPALDSVYVGNTGNNVATIIPSDCVVLEAPSMDMNNNAVPVYNISTYDSFKTYGSSNVTTGLDVDSLFEDVEFDSFVNSNGAQEKRDINNTNDEASICKTLEGSTVFTRFKKLWKKLFI